MKKLTLVISAAMLAATASAARADVLPYFGAEPNHGSYWNSPQADYPYPAVFGYRGLGYNAYAQAQGSCWLVRGRRVAMDGRVYYRSRRVCA